MGSIQHSWDLILIEKAVVNVKYYFSKKNTDVIFELIGGTVESLDYASQIEVPQEYTNYFKFIEWFKQNSDWDIAIAPLEDSNLNYSKSELKYLEYAALGIPGIYSNIGPYAKSITHMKTGLLVYENTPQEWEKAMIMLIEDKDLQKTVIANSYKDIKDNYLIKQSVDKWINIFENNLKKFSFKSFLRKIFAEFFNF